MSIRSTVKYLRFGELLMRVLGALMINVAFTFLFVFISRMLGSASEYGLYCQFASAFSLFGGLLFLGQDRLIFVALKKKMFKESLTYMKFYFVWTLVAVAIGLLLVAAYYLFSLDVFHQPILLGLVLSPVILLSNSMASLSAALRKPLFYRIMLVLQILLIIIPLIYLYDYMYGGIDYIVVAFINYTTSVLVGLLALCLLSNYLLAFLADESNESTLKGSQVRSLLNLQIGAPLASLTSVSIKNSDVCIWFKKGFPLYLGCVFDQVNDLMICLLGLFSFPSAQIAIIAVVTSIYSLVLSISFPLRNHFIPSMIACLDGPESQRPRVYAQFIQSVVAYILTVLLFAVIIILIAKWWLSLYGKEYAVGYWPVMIGLLTYLLTYAFSFNRPLLVYFSKETLVLRMQLLRFILSLILAPWMLSLIGINGFFLALGLPSFLVTAFQLFVLKKEIARHFFKTDEVLSHL